jgi:hypothetical protein
VDTRKIAVAVLLLPLSLCAQTQPKPLPQTVRVILNAVRPNQPGLVSFRVGGTNVPEQGMWATLNLTSKASNQGAAGVSTQYSCQATETLFVCPVVSKYGQPSGTFQVTSITIFVNSPSGQQASKTFKADEDFRSSGEITIENPKTPQPPNLDGLRVSDIDVDGGRTQ